MTATNQLHCSGCQKRFGKRAKTVLMFGTTLVCPECAISREAHRNLFFGCRIPGCTAIKHNGDRCSIGIARQRIAAAQTQSQWN